MSTSATASIGRGLHLDSSCFNLICHLLPCLQRPVTGDKEESGPVGVSSQALSAPVQPVQLKLINKAMLALKSR